MQIKSGKDRNVAGLEGSEDESKKNPKAKNTKLGPMLYETCDGRKLESKIYSKAEFSKLSSKQRAVVIKLNRQRRNNSSSNRSGQRNNNNNSSAINSLRTDLGSLGDAIVAGVTKAVNTPSENESVAPSVLTPNTVTISDESKAQSGGVGNFIAQSRKRKQGN